MAEPSFETPLVEKLADKRLDSWKEIAAYLGRDVTTVQRWEKREGMPVHRHLHDKRGSVYALPEELDSWRKSRQAKADEPDIGYDPGIPSAPAVIPPQSTSRGVLWTALAAVAVIAVLIGSYLALRHRPALNVASGIHSLAVLPLRNLSGDPAQDYLADGVTEALIGRLAGIHNLRVTSHTSVMRFKNPQISVPEIAKTLGVDAVVEGSVVRDGTHIRVTAQLIRAATDEHFWSETYDREARDALTLESEIAQAIAQKVEVTVTGEEQQRLTAARTVAPEVYENYLKGVFALESSSDRNGTEKSIQFFQAAVKDDPTFAPAYVGLAAGYQDLGTVFMGVSPAESRPKAIDAARKAIALDPQLVDAHVVLADEERIEWQWSESESEYRQALALNPNDATAQLGYAQWLASQGRLDEAIAGARRGRELDPLAVSGEDIGWLLFMAHRYDDAIREFRSALAVRPDAPDVLWFLGFALIASGQPEQAIPPLERALSFSNRSPGVIGVLIRAYAHAGRRADALKLLAELKRRRATGYIPAAAFVNAYLGLGDKEQAFAALDDAYKEKSNILLYLKIHPYFDPIRSDPRFADLVRRVGLQ